MSEFTQLYYRMRSTDEKEKKGDKVKSSSSLWKNCCSADSFRVSSKKDIQPASILKKNRQASQALPAEKMGINPNALQIEKELNTANSASVSQNDSKSVREEQILENKDSSALPLKNVIHESSSLSSPKVTSLKAKKEEIKVSTDVLESSLVPEALLEDSEPKRHVLLIVLLNILRIVILGFIFWQVFNGVLCLVRSTNSSFKMTTIHCPDSVDQDICWQNSTLSSCGDSSATLENQISSSFNKTRGSPEIVPSKVPVQQSDSLQSGAVDNREESAEGSKKSHSFLEPVQDSRSSSSFSISNSPKTPVDFEDLSETTEMSEVKANSPSGETSTLMTSAFLGFAIFVVVHEFVIKR